MSGMVCFGNKLPKHPRRNTEQRVTETPNVHQRCALSVTTPLQEQKSATRDEILRLGLLCVEQFIGLCLNCSVVSITLKRL